MFYYISEVLPGVLVGVPAVLHGCWVPASPEKVRVAFRVPSCGKECAATATRTLQQDPQAQTETSQEDGHQRTAGHAIGSKSFPESLALGSQSDPFLEQFLVPHHCSFQRLKQKYFNVKLFSSPNYTILAKFSLSPVWWAPKIFIFQILHWKTLTAWSIYFSPASSLVLSSINQVSFIRTVAL